MFRTHAFPEGTTINVRNDADSSAPLGMATTRAEERMACSLGQGTPATVKFEPSQALCGAGILFLLPALLAHGLLKTKEVLKTRNSSNNANLES